jgi:hypothetical protein
MLGSQYLLSASGRHAERILGGKKGSSVVLVPRMILFLCKPL